MASLMVGPLIIEPGTVKRGVWCQTCLVSSAFECSIYQLDSEGVTAAISTVSYCPQCENWERLTREGRS